MHVGEMALMFGDGIKTDRLHVIDRCAQADGLNDRRGPRLEPRRGLGPGGAGIGNAGDHVATAEERRHRLQQLSLGVERAGAGGAVEFMAGEHIEIGVDGLHVDAAVHRGLGRHRAGFRTAFMREFRQALTGV